MGRDAGTIQVALLRARDMLSVMLREYPETAPRVGELLAALGDIERAAEAGAGQSGQFATRRSGRKPKRYAVETAGQDAFLAEYRPDDPRPFRAPRGVFDAVVSVLAKAKAPLPATRIRIQAGRILGEELPEYALRLCLRFLCSKPVCLVDRNRARYVALNRQSLPTDAADAFARLRDEHTLNGHGD